MDNVTMTLNDNDSLEYNGTNRTQFRQRSSAFSPELNITLYSIIFVLSVCGNVLVIVTLIKNKKMRTITNLFLMNLAISDMMLSVLCMPFSLVAMLLRDFIFGEAMCVIIRYFQAVSVGVSCYTLVAISLERYYAICQPFKSRLWQTYAHARRMLIAIWSSVLLVMGPIAAFHRVITIQTGGHACREVWPEVLLHFKLDLVYSVTLAVLLLLIPLVLMCAYYGLMGKQLWMTSSSASTRTPQLQRSLNRAPKLSERDDSCLSMKCEGGHRSTHDPTNRKRVIRMLVVIVLQYFVCWTPLYLLNTWNAFDFRSVLRHISPTTKSLILLVAYTSSFIHPITYCFMNRNFRNGFRQSVRCRKCSNQQFATQSLRVFSASGHQGLLGNRPK